MICTRCLYRASARPSLVTRSFTSTSSAFQPAAAQKSAPPAATSTSSAQTFSTPLTPRPKSVSAGQALKPKASKFVPPVSSVAAGTSLKGLNYIKGHDDPVALAEAEYPEWLWHILDAKVKEDDTAEGDEFSKSKKLRRAAAKRQRKLDAQILASGDEEAFAPKIPLQQQTIDLPSNKEGTLEGALKAVDKREELRKAMRGERRKNIKTANYLKSM